MINTIIFDMGGVLYDIDSDASHRAFAACGIELTPDFAVGPPGSLIDQYERGKLSSQQFLQSLAALSPVNPPIEAVRAACCAMLVGMSPARVQMLQQLAKQYQLFLLSNTFEIHIASIQADLQQRFDINGLDQLFSRPYVSYEMGKRKPELAIYQQVIDEQSLTPAQTLFIDDRLENIEAAQQCGLQVLHKTQSQEITEVLPKFLS